MLLIKAESIPEAHLQIIHILEDLLESTTEDGETVKQLDQPVTIHINNPEPLHTPGSLFGPKFRQEYVKKVSEITPRKNDGTDPVYTYGNRLRDYPYSYASRKEIALLDRFLWHLRLIRTSKQQTIRKVGNGNFGGLDQIQSIIDRLSRNPNSRRAVAITWDPELDMRSSEPPCMDLLQISISESKLNLVVYFRSNDMLSAWGMNAYALASLQLKIANELNIPVGWLEIISNNPHMYNRRDAYELGQIRAAEVS